VVLILETLATDRHTLVAAAVGPVLKGVLQVGLRLVVQMTLLEMELLDLVVLVEQIPVYLDLSLAQSCQVHG
jgi:hypothetical protein